MDKLHSSSGWSKGANKPPSFSLPVPLDPYNNVTDFELCGFPCNFSIPFDGHVEDGATIASNSHSQAEKRRRDRINAQLSTLRKLIPKSDKVTHFYQKLNSDMQASYLMSDWFCFARSDFTLNGF